MPGGNCVLVRGKRLFNAGRLKFINGNGNFRLRQRGVACALIVRAESRSLGRPEVWVGLFCVCGRFGGLVLKDFACRPSTCISSVTVRPTVTPR